MRGWQRVTQWTQAHRFLFDAVGTATFALFVIMSGLTLQPGGGHAPLAWSLAVIAPLAWRRTRPAASAGAVYTVALAHVLAGHPLIFPADLAVLVALYSVTTHGPVWAHRLAAVSTLLGAGAFAVAMPLTSPSGGWEVGVFGAGGVVLLGLVAWTLGLLRRSRRVAMEALIDRARRLEVERDQQAQIATAAERARIAREMHDIVAHSLSAMVAQADGGRYAAGRDPGSAARALATIAETGRAALADMRRLLGVLRTDDAEGRPTPGRPGPQGAGPGTHATGAVTHAAGAATHAAGAGASAAGLDPQPDAADLEALLGRLRQGGLRVSLVRMGSPHPLPPGMGLAVYRVAQEALTNVLKHAGPDPAVTVLLAWEPASVVLEVSDNGRGAAAPSDGVGQGLVGMRERAAMFGGRLAAGPRVGGGWRVRLELPVPADHREVPTGLPTRLAVE